MFSLKNLVGTPRDSGSRLEFTPIGVRRERDASIHHSPLPQRMALNTDKINNSAVDSTFEDTTDRFDTLQSFEAPKSAEKRRQNPPNTDNAFNLFRPRLALVNDGSNSIQELQKENKELLAENYNLKIEVATLTKFLKQTPEDNRNLAYENVELKQQLLRAMNELEEKASTASMDLVESINPMRNLYREIVEEKDHEIHVLQQRLSELSHQAKDTSASDELLHRIEFLQAENQSLRRKLDDAASNNIDLGAIQEENNNLKSQVYNLELKLLLFPADAPEQVRELGEDNRVLERKLQSIQDELNALEREKDTLESSVRHLRSELADKEVNLERLSLEKDDLLSRSRRSTDTDSKLELARQEVADLKSKLRKLESFNRDDSELREVETNRLRLKLDSLSSELQEKESYEKDLRSQIKALMEERNSAFDSQSTANLYRSQLEALREKELQLSDENRNLKNEVAKLNDELYSQSVETERTARLKDDIRELENKLEFYEKEYGLLQEALESAELEAESHQAREKRSESKITDLKREIDQLNSKLRRLELSESQKYNESALFELDSMHKKREDAERQRLEQQIEALQLQVRKLELDLRSARASEPSGVEFDYRKYLQERSKLQMDIDDKELQLEEHKRKYSRLESLVRDKDSVVEALESRIRDLIKESRSSAVFEDSNKSEIFKLKTDYEYQLKQLQRDSERLKTDLEAQVNYYKTKLDVFMERERYDPVSSTASSSMVALLETQLDEARRVNKELGEKLQAVQSQSPIKIENEHMLAEYRNKLLDLQAKYNRAQDDKLLLQETIDTLEMDSKFLRSEKNRLELRAKNLNQELARTSKHCTKLANKLNEMDVLESKSSMRSMDEGMKARRANLQLQSQIDQLNSKLAATKLAAPSASNSRLTREVRLLTNELQYYKAKLFDLTLRANDLALMNSLVTSSIKNSNEVIKNDIVKLSQHGIYPNYSQMGVKRGEKITFKVLATFVLSMVRLKNRHAKADARRAKMSQLRGEIDRDKITLLAE